MTTVQVQQADGSYQAVPVQLVDTVGLNAIVTGNNLSEGDVVLIPTLSETTAGNPQQNGLPFGATGRPAGGLGGVGGGRQ